MCEGSGFLGHSMFCRTRLGMAVKVVLFLIVLTTQKIVGYHSKYPNQVNRISNICDTRLKVANSYFDDVKIERKVLVALTHDSWQVGNNIYHKNADEYQVAAILQRRGISSMHLPLWETTAGPDYQEVQHILNQFWIPDYISSHTEFILNYDCIVIPDKSLAWYILEANAMKEEKMKEKRKMLDNFYKKPYGNLANLTPAERRSLEIVQASRQSRSHTPKFPPMAGVGYNVYEQLKSTASMEYCSEGEEDFALYLPPAVVPTKRVLFLRYANRYQALASSLKMRDIAVTGKMPLSITKKDWTMQEDRFAQECDVVYFHRVHGIEEWKARMHPDHRRDLGYPRGKHNTQQIAVCVNEYIARQAREIFGPNYMKDIYYPKENTMTCVMRTIEKAIEHAKTIQRSPVM